MHIQICGGSKTLYEGNRTGLRLGAFEARLFGQTCTNWTEEWNYCSQHLTEQTQTIYRQDHDSKAIRTD